MTTDLDPQMPRKGDLHINPCHALEPLLYIQPFCTCECWQLHPSFVTNTFNWLTLAREGWKEYNSRQTGGGLKRFHRHHPRYVFVWPPYSTSTFVPLECGPQTVSYRIPGFHEQFSGVLQAYVVYSKTDKRNFDNL